VVYYTCQEERVLCKGTPVRSVKKIKKPLDKLKNRCYNKNIENIKNKKRGKNNG